MKAKAHLILGKYTLRQWQKVAKVAAETRAKNETGKAKTGFGANGKRTFESQVKRKLAALRASVTMLKKSGLGLKDCTLFDANKETKVGKETNRRYMAAK